MNNTFNIFSYFYFRTSSLLESNLNVRMENASLISKAQLITSRPRPPMVVQSKKMSSAAPPAGGLSLQHKLLCAGTAACIADMITFPLDTAKVRLQVMSCVISWVVSFVCCKRFIAHY